MELGEKDIEDDYDNETTYMRHHSCEGGSRREYSGYAIALAPGPPAGFNTGLEGIRSVSRRAFFLTVFYLFMTCGYEMHRS